MKIPFLIGRLVFGGFFLYSGIDHFKNRKKMAQYVSAKQVPNPDVAVMLTGAMLVTGGASLILGYKPRLGMLAIAAFLAGDSPLMHDFWKVEDPERRSAEMINFTKNLALLGASIALAGVEEPWPAAIPSAAPSMTQRLLTSAKKLVA